MRELLKQIDDTLAGTAEPDRYAAPSGQIESASAQGPQQNSPTSLLRTGLVEFQTAASRANEAIGSDEVHEQQPAAKGVEATSGPDTRVRLRKSALATLQVLLAAYLFVMVNWPLGLQVAMMLVMVLAFLNAQLPVALLTRTFMKSVLFALPMAAVFHFVVMPRIDSFA